MQAVGQGTAGCPGAGGREGQAESSVSPPCGGGSWEPRLAPVGLEGRGAAPCRRSCGLFGRPLHGSVRLTRMAAQAPGGRTATFSS